MRTRTHLVLVAGLSAFVSPGTAAAAEVTQTLTARSLRDRDVHVSLAWQHEQETASVRRELVQTTGTLIINDVIYHRSRDSLRLRAEVALVHDLSFFLGSALVVADDRRLAFDKRGDCAALPCLETLLRDGILPGDPNTSWGIDGQNGGQFSGTSTDVFRGPTRSGLEYLALGLHWAAMNQARDRAKPTWVLGLESRFSVAGDQRFNPALPTDNRAVGEGYHQFLFSSVFSQRFGAFEPYMGGWFMQPLLTSSSVYRNVGSGRYGSAQRRAGGDIGVEATLWEDLARHARIALEAAGSIQYRLEGLAQSELWEVLSGDPRCTPADTSRCRAGIDVDSSGAAAPNAGVVRSPAYGVFGGDAGFSAHIGRYARLRGLFGLRFREGHFLTNLNDDGTGNAVYEVPGRRFRIEDAYGWQILVEATATFPTF
jgi:hypothetical protein